MRVKIPNDFSGNVVGRKCDGDFPEWEIPDENISRGGIHFGALPEICTTCSLMSACSIKISSIILMPDLLSSKEGFDELSRFMGLLEGHSNDVPGKGKVIDGDFTVISEVPKLPGK